MTSVQMKTAACKAALREKGWPNDGFVMKYAVGSLANVQVIPDGDGKVSGIEAKIPPGAWIAYFSDKDKAEETLEDSLFSPSGKPFIEARSLLNTITYAIKAVEFPTMHNPDVMVRGIIWIDAPDGPEVWAPEEDERK